MKTYYSYPLLMPLLFVAFVSAPLLKLLASDELDIVAVGTTGYAIQSAGFSDPGYSSYALNVFVETDGNETILAVNPDGGFTYDGALRGNFTKRSDTLVFESTRYNTVGDL